jgi:hypothetical protein
MTIRAKFQAAEEREKQKIIAIDAVAVAERERDEARAQLASTREAHARQQSASQQTVVDFQRALSSQASKLASVREELSHSEAERKAERSHFDQRLEEAEKRFATVSRAFEQLEADAKTKASDRAIQDAVNASESDSKSTSGVFAYASRLEQEIGTLRRNSAALKMVLCLQRLATKRMRPIFNSFPRGNIYNYLALHTNLKRGLMIPLTAWKNLPLPRCKLTTAHKSSNRAHELLHHQPTRQCRPVILEAPREIQGLLNFQHRSTATVPYLNFSTVHKQRHRCSGL